MAEHTMTKNQIEAALEFSGRLADSAKQITLKHFRADLAIDNKKTEQDFDPVTQADRDAETAMRALIEAERPGDGITGEEHGDKVSESGFTWVLDPIDGTRAFVAGLPVWTTLIALCGPDGTPLIGVIDQPYLGERYLGWPNGAALEAPDGTRVPLQVSAVDELSKARIATTDAFILTPAEQRAWTELQRSARIARYGLDAYAYARLAAGTIDLVAEAGLAPYDAAALIPVVRGAGGLACDWAGNPAMPGGQLVCAATQGVLDDALVSLRSSADETRVFV